METRNRPNGIVLHRRPAIGEALVSAGRALIVDSVSRLSAADAEDFDMFDFSDSGGWWVYLREPATDNERATCAAALERASSTRRRAELAEQVAAQLAIEERWNAVVERGAYETWKAEHLAGLVETSTFPVSDTRFRWNDQTPAYSVSKRVGWYTTGDQWYELTWAGQKVGYTWSYGNAFKAFVPAELADEWYREEWDQQRAKLGAAEHARGVLYWWRHYAGCLGDDYYAWVEREIGVEAVQALARSEVYRRLPGGEGSRDAAEVAEYQAAGIDVRVLQPTGETAPINSHPTLNWPHDCPVYRDPVDGSEWASDYGKLKPVPVRVVQ